jgi:hypothetical protein
MCHAKEVAQLIMARNASVEQVTPMNTSETAICLWEVLKENAFPIVQTMVESLHISQQIYAPALQTKLHIFLQANPHLIFQPFQT